LLAVIITLDYNLNKIINYEERCTSGPRTT
jgi:hypothetical protein